MHTSKENNNNNNNNHNNHNMNMNINTDWELKKHLPQSWLSFWGTSSPSSLLFSFFLVKVFSSWISFRPPMLHWIRLLTQTTTRRCRTWNRECWMRPRNHVLTTYKAVHVQRDFLQRQKTSPRKQPPRVGRIQTPRESLVSIRLMWGSCFRRLAKDWLERHSVLKH